MKNKIIEWTIQGLRIKDKSIVQGPTQTFDTKREAVDAMMQQRQDKTAIFRNQHSYTFTLQS